MASADRDNQGPPSPGVKRQKSAEEMKPASAPQIPMGVPAFAREQHQVAAAGIQQPVMDLVPKPADRRDMPAQFPAMVAKRGTELSTMPIVGPKVQQLADFRKFKGTSKSVKRAADDAFGGLGGANQGGLYPREEAHRAEDIPSHVDYTHHRPAQMLSQLSEVMLHGATQAGIKPVEIQFGYGIKDGKLDVFASANKPETQKWLASALSAPAGQHMQAAAHSDDLETKLIGAKLLLHDEQVERRMAAIQDSPHKEALSQDMHLASAIRNKFLQRDITVVANKHGRHAEQNIGVALHQSGTQFADIQGGKIRCHACRAGLGSNMRDPHGAYLSGKVYSSQASPDSFANTFGEIGEDHEHIATQQPQRPRADSFPSLPAIKLPGE